MADNQDNFSVIVVGAGPAGLLLAVLLAQKGIPVTVLEKSGHLNRDPRASFYSSPSIYELRRAGLMEDIMKQAFVPTDITWRHIDGTPICVMHLSNPQGAETVVSLPLDKLLPIMVDHLKRYPRAQVLMSREVVSLGQDENKAWVNVKTLEGEKRLEATYIAGCDGANSRVRRDLFDGRFPGFTWDAALVATDVYYPRIKEFKWTSLNFVVHPRHFPIIAQIANDGLLRITYGEEVGLTHEQMRERQPSKYREFVPGAPEPEEYEIKNFSPYKIHQRCAESFRVGRFILAADAAHLCNPFGGMGLTGGFVDAGNLSDCLYGIYAGEVDDSILDKYSEIRMKKFKEIIDPMSSGNIRRLWDPSPEAIEKDIFFQMVKRAATDKEFAMQMAATASNVMHDFTQYYKSAQAQKSHAPQNEGHRVTDT